MGMLTIRRLLALAAVAMALASPAPASGQLQPGAAMSCTASLVTSFTPCLNFITNSSASPTADCCRSLGALVKASTGCACLILTGSVPLGVPVNRTLAVTLPRACNNASLLLQCRDASSAETPAPSPIADAPAPAPAPSTPSALPPATTATTTPETEAPAPEPTVEPTATPPVSRGQTRPTTVPTSSAWRASSRVSATAGFLLLVTVEAGLM
ncbi:hypothetical protein BS78_02G048900 [Paspalum vaginatum]|nr:hypothetical protein BS78_02G048900 [Paspalum vaginatum]